MKITPIKTHKIKVHQDELPEIMAKYLPPIKERSIVVITSKIVSICEGAVIKFGQINKPDLIKKESDFYLLPSELKYNIALTLKNGFLLPTAGIDESNSGGYYILWPKNLQKSANQIRLFLKRKFKLRRIGVIITDSRSMPLRRGVTGFALAYSGFLPLKDYIGKSDIFGRVYKFTKASLVDGLASAAVVAMGEGSEQTPLVLIEDLPFVKFKMQNPTKKELQELKISLKDDLYFPLFKSAPWIKS